MNQIRDRLPEKAKTLFDDIEEGRILGASNHIRMIAEMFVTISSTITNEPEASELVDQVSNYFKKTRGESSYAIVNALNLIGQYIEDAHDSSFAGKVRFGVSEYFEQEASNISLVVEYSKALLDQYQTLMVFDYSSTVDKVLMAMDKCRNVIIPESRVINGGYPFVRSCAEKGYHIHFIPDADMLTVLKEVDAAVIGAETFYPDGTAFNTAGSDILAELCQSRKIPYYVLTPLLKADPRSMQGILKKIITRNEEDSLAASWPEELRNRVDFNAVELVAIPPEQITAYVTEKGILTPSQLFTVLYERK